MSYKEAIAAGLFVTLAIIAGESSRGATPPPVTAKDASIPFVNSGSIWDWSADGDSAIYIQDIHRQWYHATLMGPCIDLPFAQRVGFETRGIDTLDKFGAIVVRHQRCAIQTMVKSDPPPSKAKRHPQATDRPADKSADRSARSGY